MVLSELEDEEELLLLDEEEDDEELEWDRRWREPVLCREDPARPRLSNDSSGCCTSSVFPFSSQGPAWPWGSL